MTDADIAALPFVVAWRQKVMGATGGHYKHFHLDTDPGLPILLAHCSPFQAETINENAWMVVAATGNFFVLYGRSLYVVVNPFIDIGSAGQQTWFRSAGCHSAVGQITYADNMLARKLWLEGDDASNFLSIMSRDGVYTH